MSQENEELARFGYEWLQPREGTTANVASRRRVHQRAKDPDHATYRGIDAIRRQHQGWFDAYPDLHIEPLEIRSNGDRVFVWTRFTGHGGESGAAMEMELAHVATYEGGKLKPLQEYFDRAEALEAVGLRK